jgi:hypothetical protein
MRFVRSLVGSLVLGVSILGAAACDDRSDLPADLVQRQEEESRADQVQAPATSRPTTQELVEAPRITMNLDVLPLTLQVPPHWKLTRRSASNGPLVWLEGPAPAGDVQIGLKFQEPMLPQKFELLLQGTRREIERASEPNTQLTMRQLGPATVIERRSMGIPFEARALDALGMPIRDPSGVELTRTVTPMRWRVSVYVPGEGRVDQYELNFIDLEKPQYDMDRKFLEDVLATLRFAGQSAGTPTPTPTPTPNPSTQPNPPALPR